jgi:predicted porin
MLNEGEMLMKKSLIALAVAGAMTAPIVAQADATLYGSFRIGLHSAEDTDLDLRDESTRIGIKGDVDLGLGDTVGLFHWEANVDTVDNDAGVVNAAGTSSGKMFAERLAYIGAKGSWGTALVGRQYHPHYLLVNLVTAPFDSATADAGEWNQLGNNVHKRQDNTVAYHSPVMGGFQVIGGAVIAASGSDSDGAADSDVDGYNVAAKYTVGDLYVAASYGDVQEDVAGTTGDIETWGLAASYKIADLGLAAKYESQEDSRALVSSDKTAWELAATYDIGATQLQARYSDFEEDFADATPDGEGTQWAVGVMHKLGNKGRVWVNYFDFDSDAEALSAAYKDRLAIGYRVDF